MKKIKVTLELTANDLLDIYNDAKFVADLNNKDIKELSEKSSLTTSEKRILSYAKQNRQRKIELASQIHSMICSKLSN